MRGGGGGAGCNEPGLACQLDAVGGVGRLRIEAVSGGCCFGDYVVRVSVRWLFLLFFLNAQFRLQLGWHAKWSHSHAITALAGNNVAGPVALPHVLYGLDQVGKPYLFLLLPALDLSVILIFSSSTYFLLASYPPFTRKIQSVSHPAVALSLVLRLLLCAASENMEGYLGKKGKRMGSRVKRFMRLQGAVLSNHQDAGSIPSWRVNLKDAIISCNAKRCKILIELYNNRLALYADTSRECLEWYDALRTAKRRANLTEAADDKENKNDNIVEAGHFASATSESLEEKEDKTRVHLGKNFKVVKPVSRCVPSSDSSDGSEEGQDDRGAIKNPSLLPGQVYEETPASMIFKQFVFPSKSMKSNAEG